jgi:ATP-dependent DNA helicase DinG
VSLQHDVFAALQPSGALSHAEAHFLPRQGQTDMAVEVARAIEEGGVLVAEAGTGVGKTYAYLVPALLSGEKVLVSTATKTLQDQLFSRDLPHLASALNVPVRTALLKGRSSYLCLYRMQQARHDAFAREGEVARTLAHIERWSQSTRSGDLAELTGLDDRSPAIALVTSTRENCLGAQCPGFRQCHVNQARREALAADIVVVNHHLFFADLAVRESGMAELLPTVRVAIFDEAHQLNETGVQFLGDQLSTGQLLDMARDMLAAGMQLASGLADWQALAGRLERATRDLRLAAGAARPGTRLRWTDAVPDTVDGAAWPQALKEVHAACGDALQALDMMSELAPDFMRLHERGARLAEKASDFMSACRPEAVRWVDVGGQVRLVEAPLDIARTMQTRLLHGTDEVSSEEEVERGRAWIFTSATLGTDPELSWFTEPCGLKGRARILRVESPFDYASQAALYVPRDLPKPGEASHSFAFAQLVGEAAARLGGRTLVLTTTLKALRGIGDALQSRFGPSGAVEVLMQGQWPKRRLLERFREGSSEDGRGCVLVASASFWEGVDVPGDALQLVAIDKLPFPPPNDPLVEARSQRLEGLGRSPFQDYALPEAAVALKQGAGRLIRHESDRGILLVGDVRLVAMGYGRRLLGALPPMRRLHSEDQFEAALSELAALTTASTTGPCSP